MGVCLHPKFGGWFAMRCVFLFKNVLLSNETDLSRPNVSDPLGHDYERIVDLLKNFKFNWKDSKYRNAINVDEKYSDVQVDYFTVEPKYRKEMLKKWLINYKNKNAFLADYEVRASQKKQKDFLLNSFYLE
jgi:methylmalonic aciduria homocystinuria type C protein